MVVWKGRGQAIPVVLYCLADEQATSISHYLAFGWRSACGAVRVCSRCRLAIASLQEHNYRTKEEIGRTPYSTILNCLLQFMLAAHVPSDQPAMGERHCGFAPASRSSSPADRSRL